MKRSEFLKSLLVAPFAGLLAKKSVEQYEAQELNEETLEQAIRDIAKYKNQNPKACNNYKVIEDIFNV